jgi:tetratricopeptide (TPR) repeat protein
MHRALGQLEAGRDDLEAARNLQRELADRYPTDVDLLLSLTKSQTNLAVVLSELRQAKAARTECETACVLCMKLATQTPTVRENQINLGRCHIMLGKFIVDEGRPAESLASFDKAIATLTAACDVQPKDTLSRLHLRNGHLCRAEVYDVMKNHLAAAKDWDRAVELSVAEEKAQVLVSRAASRVHAGQIAEAIADVEELAKSSSWTASQWYNFACVYALASTKDAAKKREYGDRAMELLHQAVKAGFKDSAHMKKDTDLDALRDREDFRKLLADLESRQKPPGGKDSKPD